jgi:hypothetical protein
MLHDKNLSQRIILLHIVSRKANDGMFRKNGNYLEDFCSSSGRAKYFGVRHFGSLAQMTDVLHCTVRRNNERTKTLFSPHYLLVNRFYLCYHRN